jgi:radical SAM family uncharacterized protein/radical SAM-linked protein
MDRKQILDSTFFPFVIKPGRYIGNELGSVHKEGSDLVRMAIAFPDKYELGMSHLGLEIIYKLVNDLDFAACERVFAPDLDAEERLRRLDKPLFSLESFRPLGEFDLIGFSLSYELCLTNMLTILELGPIPLYSRDRSDEDPIICAGGPACFNPEPIADFLDFFFVGEVETAIGNIVGLLKDSRGRPRSERLKQISEIPGVYVPGYYEPEYDQSGRLAGLNVTEPGAPEKIEAQNVKSLERDFYPTQPIVPFEEITHDRLSVEIMRGCGHGCRFCQAGIIYRPKRDRDVAEVVDYTLTALKETGYEELTLLSLSSSDYKKLDDLVNRLTGALRNKHVKISLPSLRPTMKSLELAKRISPDDRPSLTFALEGGTERMREVINKQVGIEEFYQVVSNAFVSGWRLIKIYFMIGLPTETDDDLRGIGDVVKNCERLGRRHKGSTSINVSISPFTPKAHTPWQWEPQASIAEISEKQAALRRICRGRNIQLKLRNAEMSYLEGVFSRGDRRLAQVIERAHQLGARFDGWSEHFEMGKWQQAFSDCNLTMEEYTRAREYDATLPWDHIDKGLSKSWLWRERERAYQVTETPETAGEGFELGEIARIPTEAKEELLTGEPSAKGRYGRRPKRQVTGINVAIPRSRVRFAWAKDESQRFIAHLATVRMFERANRRAELPVAYTQGHHPRQKLSFGPPLSLGYTSRAEYFDVQLEAPFNEEIVERLAASLPSGFRLVQAKPVMGRTPSLTSEINLAAYEIGLPAKHGISSDRIHEVMAKDSLVIKRKRGDSEKEVDIRSSIITADLSEDQQGDKLFLELALGNLGFTRPDEVLINCFGFEPEEVLTLPICRTELLIWRHGRRQTPFEGT